MLINLHLLLFGRLLLLKNRLLLLLLFHAVVDNLLLLLLIHHTVAHLRSFNALRTCLATFFILLRFSFSHHNSTADRRDRLGLLFHEGRINRSDHRRLVVVLKGGLRLRCDTCTFLSRVLVLLLVLTAILG